MEKVRVKQRCAFANLNHELAVPAFGYYVKNTPLGMCLPWAGLAKATENVSDTACAADPPSFPKRLPWHERGFLSSRDHDLFWNGDHVSLPQLCNFCGFSAFQSLCLLGMECFCDNCFFHPLLSIQSFPSSFFPFFDFGPLHLAFNKVFIALEYPWVRVQQFSFWLISIHLTPWGLSRS